VTPTVAVAGWTISLLELDGFHVHVDSFGRIDAGPVWVDVA
jgi:hypothetical protein